MVEGVTSSPDTEVNGCTEYEGLVSTGLVSEEVDTLMVSFDFAGGFTTPLAVMDRESEAEMVFGTVRITDAPTTWQAVGTPPADGSVVSSMENPLPALPP